MDTSSLAGGKAIAPERVTWMLGIVRVAVALLWIENAGWKSPPTFEALRGFTLEAVEHPVVAPFTWLVSNVVLPNFTLFGWMTLLVEASLGAFLLIGLATRFWALVAIGQTSAIMMSVLNAPNEWEWAYYLMILAHVAIFATAAGRYGGLDGLLRPTWEASSHPVSRVMRWVS